MSEVEHPADEPRGGHVGARLRMARETQGLALADVAARTRIPMRHLAMIEEGSHAGLPAPTYSAGFVKSYAGLLGLDGGALSAEFRHEIGGAQPSRLPPAPYEPADPHRTPPAGLALFALLVAVLVGLGYLYWRGAHEEPVALAARGPDQPAVTTPAPVASTPAPLAAAPATIGAAVVIGASADVWIKVVDGGRTLFLGMLKPGATFPVPANAIAPLLTTGRPGVTTITVGATPIPPVGDPDRAAKNVSLKPADLLARVAAPPPAAQPPAGASTPVENAAGPG